MLGLVSHMSACFDRQGPLGRRGVPVAGGGEGPPPPLPPRPLLLATSFVCHGCSCCSLSGSALAVPRLALPQFCELLCHCRHSSEQSLLADSRGHCLQSPLLATEMHCLAGGSPDMELDNDGELVSVGCKAVDWGQVILY